MSGVFYKYSYSKPVRWVALIGSHVFSFGMLVCYVILNGCDHVQNKRKILNKRVEP